MHDVSDIRGVRRVIVHIGLEKAASTTLQASLVAARPALESLGVAYPVMGGGGAKDQSDLRRGLPDSRARAVLPDPGAHGRAVAALRAASSSGAHTLILSGETLYDLGPAPLLQMLADGGWGDAARTAVVIVRDPAGWLNSRYAFGAIQFRYPMRFGAFVGAALGRGDVDWWRWLSPWLCEDFALKAVPLRDRRDGRSVIVRALEAMGLSDVPESVGRNEAVDPRTVEAARRLAPTKVAAGGRPAVRPARKVLLEAAAREGFCGRFQGLDDRLVAQIEAATAASSDRLALAVWGAPWATVYEASERALVPNAWRRFGPREDERAIGRVVAAVCAARGLRRPFRWW